MALPIRGETRDDAKLAPFQPPEAAAAIKRTMKKPGQRDRTFGIDPLTAKATINVYDTPGRYRLDDLNLEVDSWSTEKFEVAEGDPLSATGDFSWTWIFERDDWKVRTDSRIKLTSTKTNFIVYATMDAYEGDKRVFSRSYDYSIPRKGN